MTQKARGAVGDGVQDDRSVIVDEIVGSQLFLVIDLDRDPPRRKCGTRPARRNRRHEERGLGRRRLSEGRDGGD